MKKLLPYVLIIIALMELSGPIVIVSARTSTGAPSTYGECMEDWKNKPLSISEEEAQKDCQIRFPATAPAGQCWKNGKIISTSSFAKTGPECANQQGAWQEIGKPKPPPPNGPPCEFPTIFKDGSCQTCSFPQVSKNNVCVSCGSGTVPENNACIPCPKDTKEIINNKCVIKCQAPSTRDQSGACIAPAAAPTPPPDPKYTLLAPLPCDPAKVGPSCTKDDKGNYVLKTFDPTDDSGGTLGKYLNMMIRLFIGICAVLAVIMIVMGGVEYMTSELISSKEAGKERITNALFGLLLALGAWTLLNTINPNILKSDIKIPKVEVSVDEQIKNYSGRGECKPITSGICSPASLAAAGFTGGPLANQASSICRGESGGIANLGSGVDKCSDKNSFSFGLFQINIIAHANTIPDGVCSGIFQGNTQGTCMPGKMQDGICFERNCKVINPTQYQKCKDYITNPTHNIAFAKGLQASEGWTPWGAYNSCRGKPNF